MKYVKLTVVDDAWYKLGTEVWHYDEPRRITSDEFQSAICGLGILVRGIVKASGDKSRIDGELCALEEFSFEIVDNDGSEEIKRIIKKYSQ